MFCSEKIDENAYTELMELTKKVNADWLQLRKSEQYRVGLVVTKTLSNIRRLKFADLSSDIKRWRQGATSRKITSENASLPLRNNTKSNYFSNDKIAVYTAVFGNYDNVPDPYCVPDNCDFYIFTDREKVDFSNVWKKRDNPKEIDRLTNAGKNRYVKMKPHLLFPEYKYSIYIDGNVQIITDLTEYIHLLGDVGIGTHLHNSRNCVYTELETVVKMGRESEANAKRHIEYMKKSGMPKGYGLLQCSVIVREHNNPQCISVMDDWWDEYCEFTKRDQISLPHVLYRKGIQTADIGVLGNNIYKNPSFRVLNHN